MKLWETYFRLWQKFSGSLTEGTTQSPSKEKYLQGDDCITNYYGSVYDKCSVSGV
jgi:hypothetical protein